jgi:hypothetical protein
MQLASNKEINERTAYLTITSVNVQDKLESTVTGWVDEKIAQNVAKSNFCQNQHIKFYLGKKPPKTLGYFGNLAKTAPSKQSPNLRPFAQSGHPGWRGHANGGGHYYKKEIVFPAVKTTGKRTIWQLEAFLSTIKKIFMADAFISPFQHTHTHNAY